MIDRSLLLTMGFVKQDWDGVEVWTHEYDFWVKFVDKMENSGLEEASISGITATDAEFCKKFHDYLYDCNSSCMCFE